MDPKATLALCASDDTHEALEAMKALANWLYTGGFAPCWENDPAGSAAFARWLGGSVAGLKRIWPAPRRRKPKQSSGFACQECGRKFRTVGAAETAASEGCPKCGGVDVDLASPSSHRPDAAKAVRS